MFVCLDHWLDFLWYIFGIYFFGIYCLTYVIIGSSWVGYEGSDTWGGPQGPGELGCLRLNKGNADLPWGIGG